MQEAEFGLTEQAMGDQDRYRGDENLLVKFFMHPNMDAAATKEAGRPIYKDTPFIHIMTPGNKDNIIIRRATEMDIERFREHYRKFQAREDTDGVEGTRLEEWPGVTRSQVEELKFFNIHSVEQLISVADSNAQNIMGFQALKQRAEAYLEVSNSNAAAEEMALANTRIEELTVRLDELAAENAQLREESE